MCTLGLQDLGGWCWYELESAKPRPLDKSLPHLKAGDVRSEEDALYVYLDAFKLSSWLNVRLIRKRVGRMRLARI